MIAAKDGSIIGIKDISFSSRVHNDNCVVVFIKQQNFWMKNIRQIFVNLCALTFLWYTVLVVTYCCLLPYLLIRSSFVKWTVQHNLLFCVLPEREGHSPKLSKWEFHITNQIMDENQMICHTYLPVYPEFSHTLTLHQWQWKC